MTGEVRIWCPNCGRSWPLDQEHRPEVAEHLARCADVTVKGIIAEYLRQHGYDGLYNDMYGGCMCELADLMPCGGLTGDGYTGDCRAGYKEPCDCGDHDWHIGPEPAAAYAVGSGGWSRVYTVRVHGVRDVGTVGLW